MKLTITPRVMGEADVENLRRAGYNDMEIAEIVLVTAHFNFMNRVGMALGIEPPRSEGATAGR
ncbi:MAG: hypothetical protein HYX97_06180 [Chloroflexi bacterium]|nr:hypothetical protein [Chloroflexota bacterium]